VRLAGPSGGAGPRHMAGLRLTLSANTPSAERNVCEEKSSAWGVPAVFARTNCDFVRSSHGTSRGHYGGCSWRPMSHFGRELPADEGKRSRCARRNLPL
jgi:hypothetical protein